MTTQLLEISPPRVELIKIVRNQVLLLEPAKAAPPPAPAPVISFDPVDGSPIYRQTVITVTIIDPNGLRTLFISVTMGNITETCLVNGKLYAPYLRSNVIFTPDGSGNVTNAAVQIMRDTGFPGAPTINVHAENRSGNSSQVP